MQPVDLYRVTVCFAQLAWFNTKAGSYQLREQLSAQLG